MIAPSKPLLYLIIFFLLFVSLTQSEAAEPQTAPSEPSLPTVSPPAGLPTELPAELPAALPEGLTVPELPQMPELPKAPELPGPLGDLLKNPSGTGSSSAGGPFPPGTRTRLEIDHRKQLVLLPRIGMLYALQPKSLPGDDPNAQTLPSVVQSTFGVELQLGIKKTAYVTAELQALYILSGNYGFGSSISPSPLQYGVGSLTLMSGVGVGRFLELLDSYGLWTRAAVKLGTLYPYYGLIWLHGDVTREFRRTPQHYWELTVSPLAGLLLPFDARGAERFQRVGAMAGIQVSGAFIFAPLGG